VIGLALGINWLARNRLRTDPLLQAYLQACHRLETQGISRHAGETPSALLQRLQQAGHPACAIMQQITETYLAARYAGAAVNTARRKIRTLSRQLK